MATSRQIRRIATNPSDYIRFHTTGRLPEGVRPQSPLISLLEKISPRDRLQIVGLCVDHRIGYGGSRTFHNAEQALKWLKPSEEVFDSFPAESWRIKAFVGPLHLDDLEQCSARIQSDLRDRYPSLTRKRVHKP